MTVCAVREEPFEANEQYSWRASLRIYGIEKEKVDSPDCNDEGDIWRDG